MIDATRIEAINWIIKNQCNFREPVYPVPEGWNWVTSPKCYSVLSLYPKNINIDANNEIFLTDMYGLRSQKSH